LTTLSLKMVLIRSVVAVKVSLIYKEAGWILRISKRHQLHVHISTRIQHDSLDNVNALLTLLVAIVEVDSAQ